MQIVLVHGIWDSGKCFSRMARYLNEAGHHCHAPDLLPANGSQGLVSLAAKLEAYIGANLSSGTFALVGFSMGSLTCRHYLQRRGGLKRVSHFFSISGPHRGTLTAHLWPGKAARDMRFNSRFLREINSDLSSLEAIETYTYRTPFDQMIIPSSSSTLPGTRDRIIFAPLHHLMLSQDSVFKDIAAILGAPDTGEVIDGIARE